jgi:hypothetical protein
MTQTAKYNEELYLLTLQHNIALRSERERENASFAINNKLFRKAVPLFYHGRVRITLFIAQEYLHRFVLIKGLIEFHRDVAYVFNYDAREKVVEADIPVELLDRLTGFFNNILLWTTQELSFKARLKQAIAFEREYKKLSGVVYGGLMASANYHK